MRARVAALRSATDGSPDLDAVNRALARSGGRVTQQRKAIVAEFARTRRYVTPQELHQRLTLQRLRIGLATVYRTLEALERVGAATRAPGHHGENAYLFCPIAHHHHAVCVKCGDVADIPCGSVDRLARTLAARLRFRLMKHQLEFYGLCERCA